MSASASSARRLAEHVVGSVTDPNLFANHFQPADSWHAWLTVLRSIFGLPLSAEELPLFQ